jgi:MFS family permease
MRTPWYHGWNVLAVGMLFQAVTFGIGIYCFTFWVSPWSVEFGVGRGEAMTVFLTLQVAMGALAPFAGRAMDRASIRGLIVAGALCLALALALAARAQSLWQLAALYGTLVVAGMLLAGPLAAQTLAARWFTRRRGLALGISTVGTSLGGFCMPPLVTTLQADLGWRDANDVLALLVVVLIVPPVWLLIRNSPAAAGRPGEDLAAAHSPPLETARGVLRTVDLLRSRPFWLLVLAFTPLATAFGGAQQNLAPYTSDHGIDARATAYLVSIMALVMAFAKVGFGALADRVDLRWLFLLALGVLAVAFALMRGAVDYQTLVVIAGLLGIAAGAFLPLLASAISHRFGVAAFGQVMGMVGPFTTLAALGPWLAGQLRDSTGNYDAAWLLLAALLIPSAAAMLMLRPTRRASRHDDAFLLRKQQPHRAGLDEVLGVGRLILAHLPRAHGRPGGGHVRPVQLGDAVVVGPRPCIAGRQRMTLHVGQRALGAGGNGAVAEPPAALEVGHRQARLAAEREHALDGRYPVVLRAAHDHPLLTHQHGRHRVGATAPQRRQACRVRRGQGLCRFGEPQLGHARVRRRGHGIELDRQRAALHVARRRRELLRQRLGSRGARQGERVGIADGSQKQIGLDHRHSSRSAAHVPRWRGDVASTRRRT